MATISFSTTFNLTLTPKQFVFVDTSNYNGQGIAAADVNGCFTIIAPSGVTIYNNTDFSNSGCDIRVASSTTDQKIIPLPIGTDGLVEVGTYTIVYNVYNSNTAETYTKTATINYDYASPIATIDVSVNVISPIFSQTDNTEYVINGVTPTYVRENKLIYPAGIEGGAPSPIITSNKTLKTSIVYNGPQTSLLTVDLTYAFTGFIVIDQIFVSKYTVVDGSYYCSIACGLKSFEKKIAGCGDSTLKQQYKEQFKLAMSYVALIRLLIECNGGTGIDDYLLKIEDIIGDCNCGCNEETENFSRITGWGTLIGADGQDGVDGVNGTNGTNGIDGVALLINNTTNDTATNGTSAYATLGTKSYTLAAGALANGDAIEITTSIVAAGLDNDHSASVYVNSTQIGETSGFGLAVPRYMVRIVLTRTSATTMLAEYSYKLIAANEVFNFEKASVTTAITVNNLDTNTNAFAVKGNSPAGTTMKANYLMIKKFKI